MSPIAKIVFREANNYLDLLKEIIYNKRKDLVSVFGVSLLTYHTALALCINYLTMELGMEPPKDLVSKYSIFNGFLGLLHRIEHEDILNDESGLWRTIYKSERA